MARRGGFPGGMPGNMNNLMKQAQRMQRQMEEQQKELEEKEFTASVGGGEPLLQIDFVSELFRLAKLQGVHTTLDTAGQPYTTAEPFY